MLKDLTKGGVLSSVVGLSLPLIGASFIQMTYSLTDLFWLGQLGGTKVAAVGAVGFYMWLSNCFALITKTGVEVSVSQSIGAGRLNKAKQYAAHAGLAALLLASLFAIGSFVFSSSMVGFFRLEEAIHNDAVLYLKWVCPAFFLTFFNQTLTGVFNGSGNTRTPFYYNAMGLSLNMLLDPLLIYGEMFAPYNGIVGAAIATSLSQLVVFLLLFKHLYSRRSPLGRISFFSNLRRDVGWSLVRIGLPVGVMNALYCLFSIFIGRIAAQFGYACLAAQGLGGQIEAVSYMTAGGFMTALCAFVGQNYGAGLWDRIRKGYAYTSLVAGVIGVVVSLSFLIWGNEIFAFFVQDAQTVDEGGRYLKIVSFAQFFMIMELVSTGAFNGLGRTSVPAYISIAFNASRVPLALLLSDHLGWGISGVWWSLSITSVCKGALLTAWFLLGYYRKK